MEEECKSDQLGPLKKSMVTLCLVCQAKACEALEVLDELLESEVPIITPYLSEVLTFCLEVSLEWTWPLLHALLGLSFPVSDSYSLDRWLEMWPWAMRYAYVFSAASLSWSKSRAR